jgi:RimJ/RimL family protein N-acetyltransferase
MLDTEQSHVRTQELRLREFVESDETEVTSWFADAGELRFFAGRRLRWPLDSSQWRSIHTDPTVTAWTAVMGENPTPIGHVEMVRESQTVAQIERLAIAPVLRGRGFGRELVAQVTARCRDAGYRLVTFAAHPDNSNAIRGYRTLGFVRSAAPGSAGNVAPGSHDRVLLELRLDKPVDKRTDKRVDTPRDGGS